MSDGYLGDEVFVGQIRMITTDSLAVLRGWVVRVLAADDRAVLYDAAPGLGGEWCLRGRRSCVYYRMGKQDLVIGSEGIGQLALSDTEFAQHRPDLPLRAVCSTVWVFDQADYESAGKFEDEVRRRGCAGSWLGDLVLSVRNVYLRPLRESGVPVRPVLLTAHSQEGFRGLELLWKAHQLQRSYCVGVMDGAGLYREGLRNGDVSFYIAGAKDLAGIYV